MFESIFQNSTDAALSIKTAIICVISALLIGLIISTVYIISDKNRKHSTNFAITLVILPAVVTIVIMLVGSNIARAFSLAGAFALVRFRSVPGDSKDIASVFFAMATGLATGMGYLGFAFAVTGIIGLVYFILMRSDYALRITKEKELKITIPEDMNYQGAFEDLFMKYTKKSVLDKIKTTNLGTLYELTYHVVMNDKVNEKEFIDEIRCRNGNLNIVLCNIANNNMVL